MVKINEWRQFLEQIVVDDVKIQVKVIRWDSQLLKPVFLDIAEFFDELLSPVISILISKIDKQNIEKERDKFISMKKIHLKEKNEWWKIEISY